MRLHVIISSSMRFLIGIIFLGSLASPAYSQRHRVSEVAFSPDGKTVAYIGVRNTSDTGPNELLLVASSETQAAPSSIKYAAGTVPGSQHDIAWSPNGKEVAFLGTDTSGLFAMYLANVAEKSVNGTVHFPGEILHPRWSPEGNTIAFLYAEPACGATDSLATAPRDTGLTKESSAPRRVALFNVPRGELRLVSPAGLYVYEFTWSPDGRSLAAIAAPPPGNNHGHVAALYRIEIADGKR